MITLCMDTSHVFLCTAFIKDDKVLVSEQKECWKKQSEELFPSLVSLCDEASISVDDIDQVVISKGPGSYTGVRIAMTVGKVLCASKHLPLYTVGTMQLYAGMDPVRVVLDARGKRVYTCKYENGIALEEERAVYIDDIADLVQNEVLVGDSHLFGREDQWPDIAQHFLDLMDLWHFEENVDLVVPEYLKTSEAYLTK